MKLLSILAASLMPAIGWAEDWQGVWAPDPSICQYADQLGEHDPTPIRYSGTEFVGLENRCAIASSDRVGDLPAWRLVLTCTGEGETYDDERLLMISEDGILWEFDGIFEPYGYVRCE